MISNRKLLRKGIIDVALLLSLIGCIISTTVFEKSKEAIRNNSVSVEDAFPWVNLHSIIGVIFLITVLIHLWLHRSFLKVVITKKLYSRNRISTFLIAAFILITFSILLFISGFTITTLHVHGFIAFIFVAIATVHFITKFNQFVRCFK